ncbi:MAG: hypothetical protein Q9191_004103, partial [Dirinaria sp. TL-2023a]
MFALSLGMLLGSYVSAVVYDIGYTRLLDHITFLKGRLTRSLWQQVMTNAESTTKSVALASLQSFFVDMIEDGKTRVQAMSSAQNWRLYGMLLDDAETQQVQEYDQAIMLQALSGGRAEATSLRQRISELEAAIKAQEALLRKPMFVFEAREKAPLKKGEAPKPADMATDDLLAKLGVSAENQQAVLAYIEEKK